MAKVIVRVYPRVGQIWNIRGLDHEVKAHFFDHAAGKHGALTLILRRHDALRVTATSCDCIGTAILADAAVLVAEGWEHYDDRFDLDKADLTMAKFVSGLKDVPIKGSMEERAEALASALAFCPQDVPLAAWRAAVGTIAKTLDMRKVSVSHICGEARLIAPYIRAAFRAVRS
jgi:hypothetical protein